jgi:hypothetical protein
MVKRKTRAKKAVKKAAPRTRKAASRSKAARAPKRASARAAKPARRRRAPVRAPRVLVEVLNRPDLEVEGRSDEAATEPVVVEEPPEDVGPSEGELP